MILAAYASAVEAAFAALGSEAVELYRRTTLPYPAPLVEGLLVRDRDPAAATPATGERQAPGPLGASWTARSQRCAQSCSSPIAGSSSAPTAVSS